MIHPAPTTKLDPTLARGTVLEVLDATDANGSGGTGAQVVLSFPNNSFQSVLATSADDAEALRSRIGEMVIGRISAKARKIVVPQAGGRRLDPCLGEPRRVMGTVVGLDPIANVLVVNAGVPVLLTPTAPAQHAKDFANAEFIACDILPGMNFTMQHES